MFVIIFLNIVQWKYIHLYVCMNVIHNIMKNACMYVTLFIAFKKMYEFRKMYVCVFVYWIQKNACIWILNMISIDIMNVYNNNFISILNFSIKFELVLEFKIDVQYFVILLNLWLLRFVGLYWIYDGCLLNWRLGESVFIEVEIVVGLFIEFEIGGYLMNSRLLF